MAKTPKPKTTTPAASTDASLLLTLAALNDLAVEQRVELYVTTENRQRIGFLLQGKILHTLGDEALELLRAAGIKPTSLANARKAEWVFGTFTHPEATPTIKNLRIHNGTEAVEFSEALYDTLTLRQCELLRITFTHIGQHQHRPSPQQATEILAQPEWEEDLECFLDTGLTRAGVQAKKEADARALEAERARVADLERQIAEQQERDRLAAEAALNAPPPPPVVSFNHEEPEPEATTVEEDTPTNVVAFTTSAESDGDDESETPTETEAPAKEVEEDDDDAMDDDTTDHLTPEEIGSAVADATAGMHEHEDDENEANPEGSASHLFFCLDDLEAQVSSHLAAVSLDGLNEVKSRLERLLDAVNTAIAGKAEPQEELPKAPPAPRGRRRAAALAA